MARKIRFTRVLNRDGTFNTTRIGIKKGFFSDLYHSTLTISWPKFLTTICMAYIGTNLWFATLYFLCGPNAIEGMKHETALQHFSECFFFSVQTLATIGYGKLAPVTLATHILVTMEALTGLFGIAIATGLLFTRFSKPTARVVMSKSAVVSNHNGKPMLIFRIANERTNQIVEAQVRLILVSTSTTSEGVQFRTMKDLGLLRSNSPVFAATWTVMHPIDDTSPLKGLDDKGFREIDAEVLVSFTGIDDTLNQTVHTRHSYTTDEIQFNHRFVDILSWDDNSATIDLTKIHDTVPV